MSKVTTILNKMEVFGALHAKINFRLPRISLNHLHSSSRFGRHAEWGCNAGFLEFQKDFQTRRCFNEMENRLPVAT